MRKRTVNQSLTLIAQQFQRNNMTYNTHNQTGNAHEATENPRIAHIQNFASEHGVVLALPSRSTGLHTIGYPKAGNYTQSLMLDAAIETIRGV